MKKTIFVILLFLSSILTLTISIYASNKNSESFENKSIIGFDKIKEYNHQTLNKDITSYDSILLDYKNGLYFKDSIEKPNMSYEEYINRPSLDDLILMYDDGDGTSSNGIYGIDDRIFLSQSDYNNWPYRGICQLRAFFYDQNGDTVVCRGTGALVGPNIVLTANHVVYSNDYGWSYVVKVYPGYYEDQYNYGYASSIAAEIGMFNITHDSNDDWAILKLDSNIGNSVGYYGVQADNINYGDTLFNIAYNGLTGHMSKVIGQAYTVETYKFYHRIDCISGSSGSPIFYCYQDYNNGFSMNICGIHSSGTHLENFDYNIACRITNYIVHKIDNYLTIWAI